LRGALITVLALALAGCGGSAQVASSPPAATGLRWTAALHLTQVLDLTAPRSDGRLVVATDGRLALLRPPTRIEPFARGPQGYATKPGPEPYIALATRRAAGPCPLPAGTTYALELQGTPGVIAVDPSGRARRLADLNGGGTPNGIAVDTTGRFGYRLLVTATKGTRTTVFAIGCRGAVQVLTRSAPKVEGGLAVAPASFGRFAGQLIAPDERGGRIFAIDAGGRARTIADSGLPHGPDIGVESAGFVPRGFGSRWAAFVADRVAPGNPHPGDDAILRLGGGALRSAGVRPDDLVVASEGGGATVAVRCRARCSVRHVADGPAAAHVEGHISFARLR
jgi:hypothetical protein